jgi:hypothetical protein
MPRKYGKPYSGSFSGSGVHENKESEVTFPKPGQNHRRDRPVKNEGAKEMVLQTMVALLSLGLAVVSFLLVGRWV